MKKNTIKKLIAAAAACAMMVTAAPSATFTQVNASEMLFSHSFESGKEKWDSFQTDGGMHTLGTENGKLAVKITNVGELNYSVQMNYGPINLYKGAKYRLKYDISCTTKRYVEAMIQQGGAPYQAYTWKGLTIDSTPQSIVQEFEMEYDTDLMSKLAFNCGIQKQDSALPEHTIYLDNVSLELVDSSGADMTNPMANGDETPIVVDQVGYRANARKVAVFRNAGSQTKFSVVNAETNTEVFTGDLSQAVENSAAKESDKTGDFSKVTQAGKYYLKCGNDKSYTFEIGDSVYSKLIDDSVRMLYLQRCGVEVKDTKFSHQACHTSKAKVLYTNDYIDVNGGWHDAGDYGRYVVPGAKSVADLLYAYELDPKMFTDSIGIPESNNGKPDILDEAKFELDWMMKMQEQDSGAVHHKVSCAGFPAYIMPQDEKGELIVTPVSSTATADFCAVMAYASEVYKDYDSAYAEKCMAAAKKAWAYLEQHPEFNFKNPPEVTTGQYEDVSDNDERYWAACQMYRATGDSKYLEKINGASSTAKKGMNWMTVGDYGNLALLTMKDIDKSSEAYKNAKDTMIAEADKFLTITNGDPYGASVTKYEWGSNMAIATNGVQMAIAYMLTGDSKYMGGAEAQLDYLLGENSVAKCFVTGYGTDSPKTPHHRPSMAVGEAMKGMLVGGVDESLEDDAAQAYLNQAARSKRYIDNPESYSTNEITIYWNSPLTMLLAYTDPAAAVPEQKSDVVGTPLMGDVNCDGKVNVVDALILKKALLGKITLSGTALENACIISGDSGRPAVADLTTLMKYLSKELKTFPAYNPPA